MKLKFKKQQFQTDAVNAVVECFTGQGFGSGLQYRVDPGLVRPEAPLLAAQPVKEEAVFANESSRMAPSKVLENIRESWQNAKRSFAVCCIQLNLWKR